MPVFFLLNPIFVATGTSKKIVYSALTLPLEYVRASYTEINQNQITHKSKPNVANDSQEIFKKTHQTSLMFFQYTERIKKSARFYDFNYHQTLSSQFFWKVWSHKKTTYILKHIYCSSAHIKINLQSSVSSSWSTDV